MARTTFLRLPLAVVHWFALFVVCVARLSFLGRPVSLALCHCASPCVVWAGLVAVYRFCTILQEHALCLLRGESRTFFCF